MKSRILTGAICLVIGVALGYPVWHSTIRAETVGETIDELFAGAIVTLRHEGREVPIVIPGLLKKVEAKRQSSTCGLCHGNKY